MNSEADAFLVSYQILCKQRQLKVNKNKTAIEEFAASMNEIDQSKASSSKLKLEFLTLIREDSQYDV